MCACVRACVHAFVCACVRVSMSECLRVCIRCSLEISIDPERNKSNLIINILYCKVSWHFNMTLRSLDYQCDLVKFHFHVSQK